MKKKMSRVYRYYVAYRFQKDGIWGFGNSEVSLENEIDCWDTVLEVNRKISQWLNENKRDTFKAAHKGENFLKAENIVILNWKRLNSNFSQTIKLENDFEINIPEINIPEWKKLNSEPTTEPNENCEPTTKRLFFRTKFIRIPKDLATETWDSIIYGFEQGMGVDVRIQFEDLEMSNEEEMYIYVNKFNHLSWYTGDIKENNLIEVKLNDFLKLYEDF